MLKVTPNQIVGDELKRRAKEAIRSLLASVPGSTIEITDIDPAIGGDFVVICTTAAGPRVLLCEVKSRAWPNEIHAIPHQLKCAAGNFLFPVHLVLIAPYVSKQAAETCVELGLSWVDLAGNGELRIDGAYINVSGIPNQFKQGRTTSNLYTPKASQVVLALLCSPHKPWKTEELAKASSVSLGQVASVKKHLERNSWIRSGYGETVLTEPFKLLEDWEQSYKPRRGVTRLFSLDAPDLLEKRIAKAIPKVAFTEFSAAERIAPFTRHQRVSFYVPAWSAEQSQLLDLKSGEGASNVTIYEIDQPVLFAEEIDGVRCASPITTYLDLKLLAGRGQDAAEHLLETVIRKMWK